VSELCEWDPIRDSAAEEAGGCQNEATLSVGGNGDWHLCENCAALPFFDRYRKRVALDPRSLILTSAAEKAKIEAERLARRREVPLGGKHRALVAFVDECDYELVMRHKWHGKQVRHLIYAKTSVPDERHPGKNRSMMMHRMLLQQPAELGTDHLDGNGLNNQRYNIVPATNKENMQNLRVHRVARQLNERQSEALRSTIVDRLNDPEREQVLGC
jgi:hypothetical protein